MAIDPLFVGNIPGNSLTVEPGSVPWEQPPKYVTIEETAKFYVDSLSDPEIIYDILSAVKRGAPILSLVNVITKTSVMKGLHTVHVAFLVTPIIVEIIKTLADVNGVEYDTTFEEKANKGKVNPSRIRDIVKEVREQVKENPETKVVEGKRGLMARGE